jgi:molybdopterin molybdotransferase
MKTVIEAQEIILGHTKAGESEEVSIASALGRILAEDISSNRDHPPYVISAMDGYALKEADIKGATKEAPVVLDIVDDIRAGYPPKCAVEAGQASRIMTGAEVPDGADTVIRVEDTAGSGDKVSILTPPDEGANIRLKGENLKVGDKVLEAGSDIGPSEVGILSMVKRANVPVYRLPTVAILATGDELEAIDEPFNEKKIPNANSYSVMAELQSIGIEPVLLGIARDTKEDLNAKLEEAFQYDVLIVSGGVSVGHHDFVRPCLAEQGIEMLFWRVALRPGHPFAFGTGDGINVFALPGNPVSSMVCTTQFVLPSLRKMMGAKKLFRTTFPARLTKGVKDRVGRLHFMRVRVENDGEGFTVTPTGSQGSGILMSMVAADGLMIVPPEAEKLSEGASVVVQSLHAGEFQESSGLP